MWLNIRRIFNSIRDNKSFFFEKMILAMGTLSTLMTIIIGIYSPFNTTCIWEVCLLAAIIWGVYSICPKNHISVNFVRRRVIQIAFGDLFKVERNSIVVIPVNNYLDTQLEYDVIGANTVHGQFITYYQQNYPEKNLDDEIDKAIKRDGISSYGKEELERKNVRNGKLDKYPLGTVVRLFEKDREYYLVVATEFDRDNHVIHQPEKYTYMLLRMMYWINKYNSGHPVYLPIMGAGQTGLNLSKQKILCHMLHCFELAEHYVTTGGTTILLRCEDRKEISLNQIQYEFDRVIDY